MEESKLNELKEKSKKTGRLLEYLIAQTVCDDNISKGEPFDYIENLKKIKEEGGTLRIACGYSIKEYFEDLISVEVLKYDYEKKLMIPLVNKKSN